MKTKLMSIVLSLLLLMTAFGTVACNGLSSSSEDSASAPNREPANISKDEIYISVDKDDVIGELQDEIFSTFVEHLGRQIYGGIYQPEHPTADEDGFRTDVMDLVKDLNLNYVRYPGGNFVSGYNWKDGIGPNREPKVETTASQLEPNTIGVDEFMKWAEKVGVEVMMAVNLGDGTPESAGELVQYCNGTSGYWAEQRKANGREEPYNVKYWYLGNEMDGDWQIGHCNAFEYSERANAAAALMKAEDPTIKLIYCGSCSMASGTFPSWDKTVMSKCVENMDYISIHSYFSYDRKDENLNAFLNSYRLLDGFITKVEEIVEDGIVKASVEKEIKISLDEWNVWYSDEGSDYSQGTNVVGPPRCENVYSSMDATVVASLMSTIINHCDTIGIACMAQLVNVIAPIMVDPDGDAICQTIYYPFKYMNDNARGSAFECDVKVTTMNAGNYGDVPSGCAAFTFDEETKEGTMLVCNLSGTERRLKYSLNGFGNVQPYEVIGMEGNTKLKNTLTSPDSILPTLNRTAQGESIVIKPYSWNIIKFKTA